MDKVSIQPLAVWALGGITVLQFLILDQALLPGIHQKHSAWLQTGFFHDHRRIQVQNSHLRGEDQIVICRLVPAARPQAVAVQHRADTVTVGKDNSCRSVPSLHHGRVILIEVFFLLAHFLVVGPGFRNGHHHRLRQFDSVHHEKFQGVIQHGGVRASLIHHRKDAVHVFIADERRAHGLLSGQHPVHISTDGVNLPVMHDIPVRMSTLPTGIGIGGETGMDHRHGALTVRILQIRIEGSQLVYQEHALIDDRSAGKRCDIRPDVTLLKFSANDIQQAVKSKPLFHLRRTPHIALHDVWLSLPGRLAQHLRAYRDFSPAEEFHTVPLDNDLQHLSCLKALQGLLWKEEHSDAVASCRSQILDFDLLCRFLHQLVGNLHHQSDAVTGFATGVLPGSVLEFFHDLQCIVHRAVRLHAANADNCSDSTGIVLKGRRIQGVLQICR